MAEKCGCIMARSYVSMAGAVIELSKDALSIGTTFNYDIPLKQQLAMIGRIGFRYVSLGTRLEHSRYMATAGRNNIKKMIGIHGIKVCSLHTPFGEDLDISSPDSTRKNRTIDCYKRCIDAAQDLGARVVIFHPTAYLQFDALDFRKEVIIENVSTLLDYVRDTGVSLAVENEHFIAANDILRFSLDHIHDSRYGFCYDTSHDNLTRYPLKIFKDYGHRLLTTHISDNRGKRDDHTLPYEGSFPWPAFCRIFSKIHFNGIPLLEVEMRESAFSSASEFLQESFNRGQRLLVACRNK